MKPLVKITLIICIITVWLLLGSHTFAYCSEPSSIPNVATLATSIHLKDIITWVIMAFGFGGLITSMKIWTAQLQLAVFNTDGSPKLVSYTALDRKNIDCKRDREAVYSRMNEDSKMLHVSIDSLREQFIEHNLTDANRWSEVVACLHSVSNKVDVSCRGPHM